MNCRRTSNPTISIITDNNNNNNNNDNNKNNDNNISHNNYNDSDNDSNNKILNFSSGGGGEGGRMESVHINCGLPAIFVDKYNSSFADDLENMRYSVHNSESPLYWEFAFEFTCYPYYRVNCP